MPGPIITLLTDFGTADGYVAEMVGVLMSLAPEARIVNVSHEIPPQDIARARLSLSRYWRRFPRGTVHLVVVDPGVGTARAALAVDSDGRFLVGPDNGVLSPAISVGDSAVVQLDVPGGASPTFHGRDVFAPAAARLARGEPLAILGRRHRSSVVVHTPVPVRTGDGVVSGEVIAIDRFGNAITNLEHAESDTVVVAGWVIPVVRTFADVDVGRTCALVGSAGLLEVAVRDGSAARTLGLAVGTTVESGDARGRRAV
ncbi:MAG TPA: SAM-dependent chlorinase/fluorinase [Gemmatimonadaceae bacterium]|nr:SAM-dependent chlorinase/fluorinase [Gemmatimonadaceae bacterium]